MAQEQPTTIDLILVEQILSNLQSFTKVPKSGTLLGESPKINYFLI